MKKAKISNHVFSLSLMLIQIFGAYILADNKEIITQEYKVIKQQILNKYTRPFTILILGDSIEELSFAVANDFNAVVVMIAKDSPNLLSKCKKNQSNNTILFQNNLSLKKLRMLSECEHFDVVIAQNIHKYKHEWKPAIDALYNACDYLVVPLSKNRTVYEKMIRNYILKQEKKYNLFRTPYEDLFFISCKKSSIQRKWWGKKKILKPGAYAILSDFKQKYIHKKSCNKKNKWAHGINLTTFYMLGGSYPLRETIVQELESLEKIEHSDNSMTNIVIQGQRLELIDFDREQAIVSHKIKNVIATFKGEVICYNEPENGSIRYAPVTK